MRISETGNLLTTAPKTVDIQAECGCIKGTIGPVERLELLYDYEFDLAFDDEGPIKGTATVSMYDFEASYTFIPEVVNIDESFSFHEQGMLNFRVDDFAISAKSYPVSVLDHNMSSEVKKAFEEFFHSFLASDVPLADN